MAPSKKKAKTATRRKATKKKATRRTTTATTRTRRKSTSRRRVASPRKKAAAETQEPPVEEVEEVAAESPEETDVIATEEAVSPPVKEEKPRKKAPPARGKPMRAMGKGVPPPFVVARGEDPFRVMDEALKYAGFFDRLEFLLEKSGKPREMFQIAAKVDFLAATRVEEAPVSYVDPKLITHLFDQLLDRGFRLLRVMETRNELLRFHDNRGVKQVGGAIGYDESCYELWDLAEELYPVAYSGTLGNLPTGRLWHDADCRIVIGKNRTSELWGPNLLFANLYATLAVPTSLIALERGFDPTQFILNSLEEVPVHFGIIDAIYSRDGSPGSGGPYELLTSPDGDVPEGPALLHTDTILAGQDVLAVEAAGQRMQGVDPMTDETFKVARRSNGYKVPVEVEDLPMHAGWQGLGNQIKEILDIGKPAEAYRFGLWQSLQDVDTSLFPPQPGAFAAVRLKKTVQKFLEEVRRTRGLVATANGTTE